MRGSPGSQPEASMNSDGGEIKQVLLFSCVSSHRMYIACQSLRLGGFRIDMRGKAGHPCPRPVSRDTDPV